MKIKKLAFIASPLFFLTLAYADESPKEASSITKSLNNALLQELPFNDKESFDKASKGFIAPLADNGVIKNGKNEVIWDLGSFSGSVAKTNYIFKDKKQIPLRRLNDLNNGT